MFCLEVDVDLAFECKTGSFALIPRMFVCVSSDGKFLNIMK